MSGSTSVPAPVFGERGFQAPTEAAVLAGVQADMDAAFGGGLNPALETPQGQLASSVTAIIGDKNSEFLFLASQVDPAFAMGRMQDGIARIYFLERDPARPTVIQVRCFGLSGVTIPVGSLVQAADGSIYSSTESGIIPPSGYVTLSFSNTVSGPTMCPAQTLVIYRTIPGWDSAVTVTDGAIGNNVEGRADFESRRSASVALNAQGSLPSVRGAVLNVDGVLDAFVTHNVTDAPVTTGGVTIAAHSLYVAVLGGLAADIGQAIWTKAAPGCNFTGNTTVNVPDTTYTAPYPTYAVKYQVPDLVPVGIRVTLANSDRVPSNALDLIRGVVIPAFNGDDEGERVRIGGRVYASRFYSAVAMLGPWARIVQIEVNKSGGAFADVVSLDIDEAPTIAAGNITLALV